KLQAVWPGRSSSAVLILNESIEDFRFGARCVRDLIRARQILTGRDDESPWVSLPKGSTWIEDAGLREALREARRRQVREEEAAAAITCLANRALMQHFSDRFVHDVPTGETPVDLILLTVPLYAVCCAEFFKHMDEETPYKICANETCGRLFE